MQEWVGPITWLFVELVILKPLNLRSTCEGNLQGLEPPLVHHLIYTEMILPQCCTAVIVSSATTAASAKLYKVSCAQSVDPSAGLSDDSLSSDRPK